MADTRGGALSAAAALIGLTVAGAAQAEPARLAGIVIFGEERLALFAGGSGEPTLTVREGDLFGGERVAAIETQGIRLEGPAGPRLVTVGEDPALRARLATAVPTAPVIDPYRRERELENDQ